MCGICGFINNILEKEKVINDMTDLITHRGPDDSGFFVDDTIALGFRRLSIIDVNTGGQPIFNEDASLVLIFNGEIYNHRILREELIKLGHIFYTNTDSEVIIHSFEEWGSVCVEKFRGMFAFSIWNKNKKELFLARDPFGIKPLYYTFYENGIIYGSEIKTIISFPGFESKISFKAFDNYFSFQYSPGSQTFFDGVLSLEPGHFMYFSENKINIEKYFTPKLEPNEKLEFDEAVKNIENSFEDSVNVHKISDVEVGCFLSGGVDSSFTASYFEGHKSFTVGFSEKGHYSEIFKASNFSNQVKVKNYSKVISEEEFWEAIEPVQYFMDQPLSDPSCIALYFVCKLASEHVKVVLSGEGADELFGGYPSYQRPRVFKLYHNLFPKNVRTFFAKLVKKIPFHFKGKGFILRGEQKIEDVFIGNANIFSKEEKEKFFSDFSIESLKNSGIDVTNPIDFVKKFYEETKTLDDITKMQYVDINLWLNGDILLKADRMSMANSLELRVPFLDKMVFEAAKILPSKFKVTKKTTKYALRSAAKKRLPEQVANENKLGFPVPIRVWIKKDKYFNMIKEAFESETSKKFFNSDVLCEILENHRKNKEDNSRKIWTVYIFIIWYNIYFSGDKIKTFKIN